MIDFSGADVLVTGGTGFIGSHLVQELVNRGAIVTVTSRNKVNIGRNITIMTGDLREKKFCEEISKGKSYVFHLAALRGNARYRRQHTSEIVKNNLSVAENLMAASIKNNVKKLLSVSSVFADESKKQNDDGYGWAKLQEEKILKKMSKDSGTEWVSVRLKNVYGPRDRDDGNRAQVVAALIKNIDGADKTLTLMGTGNEMRDFIFVEDAVAALLAAMQTACGVVAVPPSKEFTIKELAHKLILLFRKDLSLKFDVTATQYDVPDPDTQKQVPFLENFKPSYTLDEGLKKTVEWYKTHNHK